MGTSPETIVVDVYLPASGQRFDLRLPKAMNSLVAAHLAAQALEPLSKGAYHASSSSVLAWHDSGKFLNAQHTLEQEGVCNGSHLLMV